MNLWEGAADAVALRSREERISEEGLRGEVLHVTATGLIARDGRVLLGKRTSTVRFAGMWDAFGGHLVPCEEPSAALVRELSEELGITALRPRFLGIYEDVDPTSRDLFRHYLFLVTRWSGDPRIANEEHSELRWFTPDEAERLDLAPSLKDTIRRTLPRKP
jgi:8-oxo-dGTP diphosphatase